MPTLPASKIFEAFGPSIRRYGELYRVPLELLEAMIWQESRGNPRARGRDGEYGLMQLLPRGAVATWEGNHPRLDYLDADSNIKVGAWFIGVHIPWELKRLGVKDTVENRLIAYNAGPGVLLVGRVVPASTRQYVAAIKGRIGKVALVSSSSEKAVAVASIASPSWGRWLGFALGATVLLGLLRSLSELVPD